MEASAKLVVLKLAYPITQFPALSEQIAKSPNVRFSDSVYVMRTLRTAEELCGALSAIVYDRGSVFVSDLCLPCIAHGVDPDILKAMGLVGPPAPGRAES